MANNTASFETDQVGAAPKDWTATLTGKGESKWTVERDETAPSKRRVLKQSGRATFPLLLNDDSTIGDGFIGPLPVPRTARPASSGGQSTRIITT
jgi:hypothetical protein